MSRASIIRDPGQFQVDALAQDIAAQCQNRTETERVAFVLYMVSTALVKACKAPTDEERTDALRVGLCYIRGHELLIEQSRQTLADKVGPAVDDPSASDR